MGQGQDGVGPLMAAWCEGDAQAAAELYRLVAPRVYEQLLRDLGDPALAARLVEATFVRIARTRGAYVRGADPVPWIMAAAAAAVRRVRREQRGPWLLRWWRRR